MALAEDERVLSQASGVLHVDIDEAAIVERHERNSGGKGAAGVQALVHGVAALLQGEEADIGILDGEQLKNSLPQHVVGTVYPGGARLVAAFEGGGLRAHTDFTVLRFWTAASWRT